MKRYLIIKKIGEGHSFDVINIGSTSAACAAEAWQRGSTSYRVRGELPPCKYCVVEASGFLDAMIKGSRFRPELACSEVQDGA